MTSTPADDTNRMSGTPQTPRARGALSAWIAVIGLSPQLVTHTYALAGPAFVTTFAIGYDRMGVLSPASVLGYGVAAFIAGVLLDRIAVAPLARWTLFIAAAACIAGGLSPWWGLLAVTMLLFGGTSGVLNVLPMVHFSDVYPEDRTRTMARWQFLVSLASVIMPLAMGALLGAAASRFGEDRGWRVLLLACAPVFLLLLATAPVRSLGKRAAEPLRLRNVMKLARSPMFATILVLGVLHTAADNTAYFWIILMARDRFHAAPAMTGILASAHGLSYVCGRLLRGTLRWPLGPLTQIATGSLIGSIILLAAVRAPSFPALVVMYAGAGLFMSLNWPSTLGFAGERFPTQTGTVLGAVNGISGPGTLLLSAIVGKVSHDLGVATGMLIPPAMFFALSVFAWISYLRSRRAG
jgi:MFS family permease